MTIPVLPALSRTSPTFRADLDAFFLTQLPATTGAIDAAIAGIDGDVTLSQAARDAAQLSAAEAATSKNLAQGYATSALSDGAAAVAAAQAAVAAAAAANTSFKGLWNGLIGPLNKPSSVYHANSYWLLLANIADAAMDEPGVSDSWVRTSAQTQILAYADRGNLRALPGGLDTFAVVTGIGLFGYQIGSTEPDDDESCFVAGGGCWLLQAAHWDLVDAWQLPEVEERDAYDEDEPLRFAASFAANVIAGSATCAITSVAATASVSFTGTVTGAAIGDCVIATPPAQFGSTSADTGRLSHHAWVSDANTVTIMLTNASASAANTNAAIRAAWPITVIKS